MSDNTPATATPPAPSGATPPAPLLDVGGNLPAAGAPVATEGDGISADQQATLYSDLVARGAMTREAADKEIAAAGGKPLAAPASAAADAKATIDHLMSGKDPAWRAAYLNANDPKHAEAVQRLANLRQTAQTGQGGAAAPGSPGGDAAEYFATMKPAAESDFQLPPLGDGMTPQEQVAMSRTITGALADAKLSKLVGQSILNEGAKLSPKIAAMSDAERAAFNNREMDKLERMWGDKAPAKIALARQLVAELEQKRPGIREMLFRTGLSSSSTTIAALVRHAEALAHRA